MSGDFISTTGQTVTETPIRPDPDWQDISTAPRDGTCFLGVVDGSVRLVGFGKTSHLPWTGFCLADQGVEDFDICTPSAWMPLPAPPKEVG